MRRSMRRSPRPCRSPWERRRTVERRGDRNDSSPAAAIALKARKSCRDLLWQPRYRWTESRRPVALRPRLSTGLPFSRAELCTVCFCDAIQNAGAKRSNPLRARRSVGHWRQTTGRAPRGAAAPRASKYLNTQRRSGFVAKRCDLLRPRDSALNVLALRADVGVATPSGTGRRTSAAQVALSARRRSGRRLVSLQLGMRRRVMRSGL